MARARFAWDMFTARWAEERNRCPYCESSVQRRLQRKKLLIELRKCEFCGLLFRWPCDDPDAARRYYEGSYDGQQATTIPTGEALHRLVQSEFRGTPYDRGARIEVAKSVVPSGRVLDFGCSWGYAMVQWAAASYQPVGFEAARDRAAFGRDQLGLDIRDDLSAIDREPAGSFDLVYADHVMEHLTVLRRPLELFSRLVKPGGALLLFTPNGGGLVARQKGTRWPTLIGESHTIALTADWYNRHLPDHGFSPRCFSGPLSPRTRSLVDDEELVCLAIRD